MSKRDSADTVNSVNQIVLLQSRLCRSSVLYHVGDQVSEHDLTVAVTERGLHSDHDQSETESFGS